MAPVNQDVETRKPLSTAQILPYNQLREYFANDYILSWIIQTTFLLFFVFICVSLIGRNVCSENTKPLICKLDSIRPLSVIVGSMPLPIRDRLLPGQIDQ